MIAGFRIQKVKGSTKGMLLNIAYTDSDCRSTKGTHSIVPDC